MIQKDYDRAYEILDYNLGLAQQVEEEANGFQEWENYAIALWRICDLCLRMENLEEAETAFRYSLDIRTRFIDQVDSARIRKSLVPAINGLARVYERKKDHEQALSWLRVSYSYNLESAELLKSHRNLDGLAISCFRLGHLGVKGMLLRALEIWEQLAKEYPENPIYTARRNMARDYLANEDE